MDLDSAKHGEILRGPSQPRVLLAPPNANDPRAERIEFFVSCPVANLFVHVFGDNPHPWVGIERLCLMHASLAPNYQSDLSQLV